MSSNFRFQDLEIWRSAIGLGERLFDIADLLEKERLYRFADQLRGAGMSVSNNIAEGSGCDSPREFAIFLGFARRSLFEVANIAHILASRGKISEETRMMLWEESEILSCRISTFKRSLR